MVLGSDQIVMVTLTRVQTPAAPLWSFKTEVDGFSPLGLVLRGPEGSFLKQERWDCDVWGSALPWGVGLEVAVLVGPLGAEQVPAAWL